MTTATTTATLPALTGSEKQINWATTIRERRLAEVNAIVAQAATAPGKPGLSAEAVESKRKMLRRMCRLLASQPKAAFWIERRDRPMGAILWEMQQICEANDARKAAAQS